MWRDLYELAKRLLGISEELQRNRADIKELQQEMRLVSGLKFRVFEMNCGIRSKTSSKRVKMRCCE